MLEMSLTIKTLCTGAIWCVDLSVSTLLLGTGMCVCFLLPLTVHLKQSFSKWDAGLPRGLQTVQGRNPWMQVKKYYICDYISNQKEIS